MLFAMNWSAMEPAFWSAFYQLLVVAIVGLVGNVIYRRFRDLATACEDLLQHIDEFSRSLYKPRKLYQVCINRGSDLLAGICSAEERDFRRLETIHHALADLIDA